MSLVLVFAIFSTSVTGIYTYTRTLTPEHAYAATSDNLNFQARLLTSNGSTVPDGYYNIEFNLYDVNAGGTALWTESYYDTNGVTAGNDFRVRVVGGYFSANLGSLTAFPAINWDQNLWLTMNVGGSTQTATPTYDGEMTPRVKLTAVPFAQAAKNVYSGNTSTASTNSDNVSIQTGNATGTTSNSGNITLDVGTATQTTGTISVGTANTSGITIGRVGVLTRNDGNLTIGATPGSGTLFTNNGATLNATLAVGNDSNGGALGGTPASPLTAAQSVDIYTTIALNQTTAGQDIVLPNPTSATAGRVLYILNSGSVSFTMHSVTIPQGYGQLFIWNGSSWRLAAAGGGAAITLQAGYDGGNTITSTNARDLNFTSADTATDANLIFNAATGSTGEFKVQNNGTDVLQIGANGQLQLDVQGNTGGIVVGTDANLYRSAADTLRTDDSLVIGSALSTLKGADFSTTGTSNNVSFGTTSLVRLTGASAQTITGITGGTDGRLLVLVNAASQSAVIANNDSGSSVANRIITGTGSSITVQAGSSISLIYDSGANFWRVVGGVATNTSGAGAPFLQGGNTFGAAADLGTNDNFDLNFRTNNSTKATLTTAGQLQVSTTGSAGGLLLGGDANLYRSAADTLMTDDALTVAGLITGQAGLTVTGGASSLSGGIISLNASSNFATNINTGTSTGAVTIGNGSAGAISLTSSSTVSFTGTNAVLNTTGQLQLPTSGGTGGLLLGGDAALYRSAADYLRTTATFDILQTHGSAFAVREATGGVASFLVNTSANAVSVNNGADLTGWSGDFGSQTFNFDASNGSAQLGSSVTTSGVLNIGTNTTTAAGGIYFGTDTKLYRSSAGGLSTDALTAYGTLTVDRALSTDTSVALRVSGESFDRVRITADGKIDIGSGSAARDTNLYRSAANVLATDDSFSLIGTGSNLTVQGTGTSTFAGNVDVAGTLAVGTADAFTVTAAGNVSTAGTLDVTSSAAFKKGTDFATTGTTNDANFGEASLIRLTGASAQTITGIANGRDGEILTLINAASQSATITNNDAGSTATNRIITGTGGSITLTAGSSITLIYDSSASFWRVTGSVAATGGSGVNTIGAVDTTPTTADGARISGTTLHLQYADATYAGLVSATTQTIAGAKTLTGALTVSNTVDINVASTTALQVRNGATALLTADTTNGRVSIGTAAPANGILTVGTNTTTSAGGLYFGTDTNLYRSSANELRTDDTFLAGLTIEASKAVAGRVAIGAVGPASAAGVVFGDLSDTNLYRSAANTLMTDDALTVAGLITGQTGLTVTGGASSLSGGIISLNTSSNFATNINTGTSTGAVSIGNGSAGAIGLTSGNAITLTSGGTSDITLNSAGTINLEDETHVIDADLRVRNGASTTGVLLQSSGTTTITGTTSTDLALILGVSGDAEARYGVDRTGLVLWGDGTAVGDTNLYRSAANTLKTDDALIVAGATTLQSTLSVTGAADFTSSVAFKKGTDFSTTGTTNDANFGEASLIRLTGASAQTITGIANGRDGEILTLVNAASQSATVTNNDAGSVAANRIITGTGGSITLTAGSALTLIYDSGASLWRVTGTVAASGGSGVNTIGAVDTTPTTANGARISGTSLFLQYADASFPGLMSTTTQTFAGNKTFNGTLTVANSVDVNTGSTTALQVRNGATALLTADTTNGRVSIGTASPANGILTVGTNTTTAAGGLYFGTDVNLYRSAADTLRTDDALTVAGLLTGQAGLTITGGASSLSGGSISLNASSNFATNINTGSSTGAVNIGNGAAGAIALTSGSTVSFTGTNATLNTTGQLQLPTSGSTGGLVIGGDANLYRSAADTLTTDDEFRIYRGTTATNALSLRVTGDSSSRFVIHADGQAIWGDGAGAFDTNLYRLAANSLATDDSLTLVGTGSNLVVQGTGSSTFAGNVDIAGTLAVGTADAVTITTAGLITTASDVAINGGDLTTTAGTFNLLNAATTVNLGSTAIARTVNIATGAADQTVNIGSTNTTSTTNINGGSGGVNVNGNTVITGTLGVSSTADFTSSVAFKKGTDFATTGTTNDANFGEASLIRLTGASAQTITGIANGRDGEILTLVNSAAQSATITNNDAGSVAANRIITGTGSSVTLQPGGSISLIYDSSASLWRVVGSAAANTTGATGAVFLQGGNSFGVAASLGTNDNFALNFRTNNVEKATLTTAGDLEFLQASTIQTNAGALTVDSATALNLGTTDATSVSISKTGVTTTVNGALTVAQLLTGQLGATVSGAAISLNDSSNFNTSINGGTSTGTITLGNSLAGAISVTNASTINITAGTTLTLGSTGANNIVFNAAGGTACQISGSNGSLSCNGAGTNSERFGASATAVGTNSTALGYFANTTGNYAVSLGANSDASAYSTAVGDNANASGGDATAIGNYASTADFGGIALGTNTYVQGLGSVALGYNATTAAAADYSIALGYFANATAANQLVAGSTTQAINDVYIGSGVTGGGGFTLQASGATGTDISGGDTTIAGGKSTGNAIGGDIIFSTSDAGASGATLQTLSEKARITSVGQLQLGVQGVTGGLTIGGDTNLYRSAADTLKTDDNLDVGLNLNLAVTSSTAGQITQNGTRLFHTYGTRNLFSGASAGNFALSGASDSVGIGSFSLNALTTGDENTAVGSSSLDSNTIGSENTAVGYQSLQANIDGTANSALGWYSLGDNTSGDYNTAVGNFALNGNTTGSLNSGLGYNTGTGFSNLSHATVIGADAIASSSNTIVLGRITDQTVVGSRYSNSTTNLFQSSSNRYNTGTISQSGNTITGTGTTFTAGMVGGTLYYNDGTSTTVTAYTSATSIDVASGSGPSGSYSLIWGGFNVSNIGTVRQQNTTNSVTAFQIQNTLGTSIFTANTTAPGITVAGTLDSNGGIINLNNNSNFATNINTGTSTGAVSIGGASAGIITLQSNNATAGAIAVNASNIAGGIDLDAGTGGVSIDSTGAISLDSTAIASNFGITANSASNAELTLSSTNAGAGDGIITLTADQTINLNAATIAGTATTQNLFNTTATTINFGGAATLLNIGPTGSGASSIVLSGGSADTGCTIDGATGNLVCSGNITGNSAGTVGYWSRTGTTVSTATAGDAIQTSGTLNLTSNAGTFNSGILLGASGDVNLYRLNSSVLATTDNFRSGDHYLLNGAAYYFDEAGTVNLSAAASGTKITSNATFNISRSGGKTTLEFASNNIDTGLTIGSGAGSVNLYKSAADTLKTDDAFTAAGLITGELGATVSGATINLNDNSNFATNINTGTSTGAVSIGGASAGIITLQSNNASAGAIAINASNAAGGIDLDAGTGGVTIDSTGAISLDTSALASNFTLDTNNAADATLSIRALNSGAGTGILLLEGENVDIYGETFIASTANEAFKVYDAGFTKTFINVNTNGAGALQVVSATDFQIFSDAYTTNVFDVDGATGNTTIAGDLGINGGDLTTTATTFNLLAGATTALNIGPAGAVGSMILSGGSADTGCTLDGTTGNLTCTGTITGSGESLSLQGAYDLGNTILTTNARDIDFTLADTATDANFTIDIATGSTGEFQIEANGTDVLQIGSAGQLQLDVQGNTGGLLIGTDTNLYRSAANTLKTDDNVLVQTATNSTTAFQTQNSAGTTLLGVDTTYDAANLITNGGFETNTTGWAARAGTTNFQRVTTQLYHGNASLQFTSDATGEGVNYPVTLANATTYTAVMYVKNTTSSTTSLAFGYAPDGATETTFIDSTNNSTTGGWTRHNFTFTTTTTSGTPYFFIKTTSASARDFFVDGISIKAVTSDGGAYQEGAITLGGVITSPVAIQNSQNSTSALTAYQVNGDRVFNVDTLNANVTIGNTTSTTGKLSVYNGDSGLVGLYVQSGTATDIVRIDDGSSTVFKIADEGAATFTNKTNSTTAFQIQNASAQTLFVANTTAQQVAIGPAAVPGNGVLTVGTDTTTASGGLYFGTDTSLYRSAGSVLSLGTDDSLRTANTAGDTLSLTADTNSVYLNGNTTAGGDWVLASRVAADANVRMSIMSNGQIEWGSGAAAQDVSLSRSSAGGLTIQGTAGSVGALRVLNTSGTVNVFNVDTTNLGVGVGTNTPIGVQGSINFYGSGANGGGGRAFFGDGNTTTNQNVWVGEYGAGDSDIVQLHGKSGIRLSVGATAAIEAVTISSTGTALFKNGTDSTTGFQVQEATSGTVVFDVDTLNERVGVGLAAPTEKLHVRNTGDSTDTFMQIDTGSTAGATSNAGIAFRENGGAGSYNSGFDLQYDSGNNAFELQVVNGGVETNVMEVDRSSGIVGFRAVQNNSRAFTIQDTSSNDLFTVDNSNALQGRAIIGGTNLTNGAQLHFKDSSDLTYVMKSGDASYLGGEKGLTFATAYGTPGDVFALNGSNGAAIFQNSANSTTGFQIQNVAGTSNLFVADTTNSRIGIGTNNPSSSAILTVFGSALIDNDGVLKFRDSGGSGSNVLTKNDVSNNVQLTNASSTGSVQIENQNDTGSIQLRTGSGSSLLRLEVGLDGDITTGSGTTYINTASTRTHMLIQPTMAPVASSTSHFIATSIAPTVNYTAGGAGAVTALLINPTWTAVPSGNLRLVDLQNGGTSVFNVSRTGIVTSKNSTDSTAAFMIQQAGAGATIFNADTTNLKITIGNTYASNTLANRELEVGKAAISSTIRIGSDTNGVSFNDATTGEANKLRFYGTGRNSVTETLSPEFAGATMTGDGSNNTGTMTSDFCGRDDNNTGVGFFDINPAICAVNGQYHNYYSWTAQATNDYDVYVKWKVPNDFSSFDSTPMQFYGWRTSTSDSVTFKVYRNGTECDSDAISGTVSQWNLTTSDPTTSCTGGSAIVAGDELIFKMSLSVGVNNEFARMGEIYINYLSKF